MEPNQKRLEEERKRIMEKYGVQKREPSNPGTSRYLEYRRQEKEREERIKHPEMFEEKEKTPEVQNPLINESIEPVEEAPKKKSFFSKLLGR